MGTCQTKGYRDKSTQLASKRLAKIVHPNHGRSFHAWKILFRADTVELFFCLLCWC